VSIVFFHLLYFDIHQTRVCFTFLSGILILRKGVQLVLYRGPRNHLAKKLSCCSLAVAQIQQSLSKVPNLKINMEAERQSLAHPTSKRC